MSIIDVQQEKARRDATNDNWYVTEQPYALEIKGASSGDSVFVFPLGPSEMAVKRVFKQSIVATLGGVVAEEHGIAWRDLHVSGNFGLYPKHGTDTTAAAVTGLYDDFLPATGAKLSGPMWTRRLLRHFFDRYADLKADPNEGHNVVMCWHNFRDKEHWVVIPIEVDVNRTASERLLYPFTLTLKAIGDCDRLVLPRDELGEMGQFLRDFRDAFAGVKRGLAQAQAGIQENSGLLGEIRYFVATIDSIIDDVTRITSAAQDFVDGVVDTISLGATFINSTTALLEEALALMETTTDLPREVRQNYQMTLDGVHAIQAQYRAFGRTYGQEVAEFLQGGSASDEAEAAAAAVSPPTTAAAAETQAIGTADAALRAANAYPAPRQFGTYAGYITHVVTTANTLPSLAAQYLGSAALWYEIAVLNNLQPPYISLSGIPGTVRPGATIAIPRIATNPQPAVADDGTQTPEALFGTDLLLRETRGSRPGRPVVDFVADRRTLRDAVLVAGTPNLVQAIQVRTWTIQGTMPLYQGYGRPRLIGDKILGSTVGAARLALRSTLLADSRIQAVAGMVVKVEGDYIDFDADVVPIGTTDKTTITTALV